jgi:pimeloyl-ACP methyl ester carboxylesterase
MAARAVELATEDGVVLCGVGWDRGPCWLVLLHERGADLDRFRALGPVLDAHGLSALALDRRGHGGSSGEGPEEPDVRFAVRWARGQGAECVIVVAAGDAALVALAAVGHDPPDGYVLLSPAPAEPDRLPMLRGDGVPKLVLVGQRDRAADAASAALQRVSIGWSLVIGLPTSSQGTALLEDPCAGHAHEQLVRFARETHWTTAGAMSFTAAR